VSAAPLAFEDVSARVGGRDILRGLSLELGRGELLALVGRNGAGKTTLFRVATRVLPVTRGSVRIGGAPLDSLSRAALARALAVVPQEAHVAFPFSVAEIVLMGRSPHLGAWGFESRADVECAQRAMESVGVADLADRSILELSGGERQLVLVARALAQDPEVLLLDEPTAHLDLRHRLEILERVRDFTRSGRSALVVSHDLGLAARSCDRMALLSEGRVLAVDTPAAVLTSENLLAAFGVEAEVHRAPDGTPWVVPRAPQAR
jgi:iron complex transport system ATP-binding protein